MTTYIPQLTIPHAVFANPAASVLLPLALGMTVGYSTRRTSYTPLSFTPHVRSYAFLN